MGPQTWARVQEILQQVESLEGEERQRKAVALCAGDSELQAEVERMLQALEQGGDYLERASWSPQRRQDLAQELGEDAGEGPVEILQPGQAVGAYRVQSLLGRGGMGEVYEAQRADGSFDKPVALKISQGALRDRDARRRFERERLLLARLEHPHIARLYDGGATEEGRPFFVMELVRGEAIDRYADRHNLDLAQRIALFVQVAAAVEHAHRNLIIHRDLKPSNVLVDGEGKARLLDFGLAKLLETEHSTEHPTLTAGRQRPMTLLYASPEQVSGEVLTTATDVHGLGLLLYRLLTGQLPYGSEVDLDLPRRIAREEPPLASRAVQHLAEPLPGLDGKALSRALAGDLEAILAKALRKQPDQRYGSVAEMLADLHRYQQDLPVLARRGSRRYRAGKFLRRHRLALAMAAAVFALTLGFAAFMAHQARLTATARDLARGDRDRADRVSDFMVQMFEVSHPDEGVGEGVTARQLIDLTARRLEQEAAEDPLLQARLLATVGETYRNLGVSEQARALLERSNQINRQQLGDSHLETGRSAMALARLAYDDGEYERSEQLASQAFAVADNARAEEARAAERLRAEHWTLIGLMRLRTAQLSEAEQSFQQAIDALDQDATPSRHLRALGLLGRAQMMQGKLPQAEQTLSQVLAGKRELFGAGHPTLASSQSDLAGVLRHQGRFEESAELSQASVDLLRNLLPAHHPTVLQSMTYLGNSLAGAGRLQEAVAVRRELLAGAEAILPDPHPNLAIAINALALSLAGVGRPEEALALHRRSLEMRQRIHGERHSTIAQSHHAIGRTLMDMGQLAAAETSMRKAQQMIADMAAGEQSPEAGLYSLDLADLLRRRGEVEESESLARAGLERLGAGFAPGHRLVRHAHLLLAEALTDLGRLQEAEQHLASAQPQRPGPVLRGLADPKRIAAAQQQLEALQAGS